MVTKLASLRRLAFESVAAFVPFAKMLKETQRTQAPVYLPQYIQQRASSALGLREFGYWPMHPSSVVQNSRGVVLGHNTAPGLMPGCYLQGIGGIFIGDNTRIGPHVGIHSVNHSPGDILVDKLSSVRIGRFCWLGMAAQVLPGVELGDFTTVAAGAVVSNSFPEGRCVLAGVPARPLRTLDDSQCIAAEPTYLWHGFVPHLKFAAFRAAHLAF